jgi:hypothetical protein
MSERALAERHRNPLPCVRVWHSSEQAFIPVRATPATGFLPRIVCPTAGPETLSEIERNLLSNVAPALQSAGHRNLVSIVEIATDRNTGGNSRRLDVQGLDQPR